MITAPERTEHSSPEQAMPGRHIKAQGHLRLVDWDKEETTQMPKQAAANIGDPVQRTAVDRLFERGVFALMVVIVLAVITSFVRL